MIEASNYIDAASLDSVGVLDSWYIRIDVCKRQVCVKSIGFSVEQIQRYVNYDKLTWIFNI